MLAYTGLETVANLAEEAREPGRTLPRSLFSAIGLVVLLTVLVATVGMSAFPADDGSTALGDEWLEAPIVGIVTAFEEAAARARRRPAPDRRRPLRRPDPLRRRDDVDVRLHAPRPLDGRARHAAARVRPARAAHARLPGGDRRDLALDRRRDRGRRAGDEVQFLASVFSFGVLLAFTLAQLAVIALRRREPDLERPFRARPDIVVRGVPVPVPAIVGAALTFGIWVLAMVTHPGAPVRRPGVARRRAGRLPRHAVVERPGHARGRRPRARRCPRAPRSSGCSCR